MARASWSTTVTELETKEISPKMKFVPRFSRAAAIKVSSSTGISAATARMIPISSARESAWESPTELSI